MNSVSAIDFYRNLKAILPASEFARIEKKISSISRECLEAFWHIIVAGYSVDFALNYFELIYDYIKDKAVEYPDVLKTYVIYPGLDNGFFIEKKQWFELN